MFVVVCCNWVILVLVVAGSDIHSPPVCTFLVRLVSFHTRATAANNIRNENDHKLSRRQKIGTREMTEDGISSRKCVYACVEKRGLVSVGHTVCILLCTRYFGRSNVSS